MKKLCCLLMGMVLLFASCARELPQNEHSVEITGSPVQSLDGRVGYTGLVRKGDALYYVYNKDTITMKIVEISADGVKTIYTEPSSPLSVEGMVGAPLLCVYEDELIIKSSDKILQYQTATNQWVENGAWSQTEYLQYSNWYPLDDCVLYECEEEDPENELGSRYFIRCHQDGESTTYENDYPRGSYYNPKRTLVYAHGDTVAYFERVYTASDQQQYKVYKYSIDSAAEVCAFSTEPFSVYDPVEYFEGCTDNRWHVYRHMTFEEDVVIANVNVLDLDDPQASPKTVYTCASEVSVEGVYNGCIYIASENGVVKYNLETDEQTVLSDRYAENCYILDDTWVYFISDDASLWRVAQDASVVEHVYG